MAEIEDPWGVWQLDTTSEYNWQLEDAPSEIPTAAHSAVPTEKRTCRSCDAFFYSTGSHLCEGCTVRPVRCDTCREEKLLTEFAVSNKAHARLASRVYIARNCRSCIIARDRKTRLRKGIANRLPCARCSREFVAKMRRQPFCADCLDENWLPAVKRCRQCGHWTTGECCATELSDAKRPR